MMTRLEIDSTVPRAKLRVASAILILSVAGLGCLARSAAQGDVEAVRMFLAQGTNIEATDWKQRSPLELSIILKRNEVLDLLIEKGADVHRRGKGTRTPLIWASMRWGSPEVIHKLIDAGADPNGTDAAGQTPLFFATLFGSPLQMKALIERGADVNHLMSPKWKSAVLAVALRRKKISAVELLVAAGADIDATDSRGRTAREQAARRKGMNSAIDRGLERLERRTQGTLLASAAPTGSRTPASPMAIATPIPPTRPRPTPNIQNVRELPAPRVEVAMTPKSRESSGLRLGNYHALVIGNDDYAHLPKLRTAVNDAKAISDLLRDRYGYEVTTLLDASRSEILHALSRYRRILREKDNLLIYYAGHGWLDEDADRGYWLPIDATQDDDVYWIANESITSKTRAMEAKHVMVIADSCYSGKLIRGIHVNQHTPNYLKRLATRRARVVLTSGGIEPVSDAGGRNNHSVFAAALLEALEENEDVLEGHELFTKVRRPVAINSDQIPEYSDMRKAGHDGGDFLFILP